jgi:hypothetical protein
MSGSKTLNESGRGHRRSEVSHVRGGGNPWQATVKRISPTYLVFETATPGPFK